MPNTRKFREPKGCALGWIEPAIRTFFMLQEERICQ